MPRKAEPSFELKKIIWDVAATVGKDKLEAICRQVDYELEKARREVSVLEDVPDPRTIRRIVEKDINELDPEVVLAKLPPHVWRLRDDYEAIKCLAERKTESPAERPSPASTTPAEAKERADVHEHELRALIREMANQLRDLDTPMMPHLEPFVLPRAVTGGVAGPAYTRIETDVRFQAMMEHLADTDIPELWKKLEVAKIDYLEATYPSSAISENPEFVQKHHERIEALKSRRDEIWQSYCSLSFSLVDRLEGLLLLPKLPGKCRFC